MAERQFASGTSPWGAGLSSLGQMLEQFLSMRMGMQEKDKDRQARAKELSDQHALEEKRIGLDTKRVGLEEQGQRNTAAGAFRGQLTGGAYDDPSQVSAIASAFKGTPYEGLFQNKSSLPSTQYSDAGMTSQEGGKPFGYLQPTSQEERDKLLMKMEQDREQRESAEAPLRKRVLANQAVTSDPAYLEKRLKEQHGFDLEDIRAKVRAAFDTGKKTSFDDDMRTFINGMQAMDTITNPNDREVAETALMGFLSTLKTKYPQLQQMGPKTDPCADNPTSDACLSTKTPPAAAPGGGMMDMLKKFLGGGAGTPTGAPATPSGSRVRIF